MKHFISIIIVFSIIVAACSSGRPKDVITKKHGDAQYLLISGNRMFYDGRYDQAANYYARAKGIYLTIDNQEGVARAVNNIGELYAIAGDDKSAKQNYDEALRIGEQGDITLVKAVALNNLGALYLKEGRTEDARKNFEKALNLYEAGKDNVGTGVALSNLGLSYIKKGDFAEAEMLLNQALKILKPTKNHRSIASVFQNFGRLYEAKGDYENALLNYEYGLKEDKLIEYSVGIADDLIKIANIYERMNDSKKALSYYERAYDIYNKLKFQKDLISTGESIIRLAGSTGDSGITKKYKLELKELK
ncbi:MAG: tetratricopeptide repeat protein [Pseudomonadota bacterium]